MYTLRSYFEDCHSKGSKRSQKRSLLIDKIIFFINSYLWKFQLSIINGLETASIWMGFSEEGKKYRVLVKLKCFQNLFRHFSNFDYRRRNYENISFICTICENFSFPSLTVLHIAISLWRLSQYSYKISQKISSNAKISTIRNLLNGVGAMQISTIRKSPKWDGGGGSSPPLLTTAQNPSW